MLNYLLDNKIARALICVIYFLVGLSLLGISIESILRIQELFEMRDLESNLSQFKLLKEYFNTIFLAISLIATSILIFKKSIWGYKLSVIPALINIIIITKNASEIIDQVTTLIVISAFLLFFIMVAILSIQKLAEIKRLEFKTIEVSIYILLLLLNFIF